ncbi:MAG: nickel insertion protein [Desulfatiglandales bacterium]
MEKKSKLIFAQIDHVAGEVLGFAMERLMELGANNVQLIPTITKKNRPGNIIIIDIDAKDEEVMAEFLAKELKVPGYHRINTAHIFHHVSFSKKTLNININGAIEKLQCEIRLMGDPSSPLSVGIEHDFLVKIQKLLSQKLNNFVSLTELRTIIESKLREPGDEITIEL